MGNTVRDNTIINPVVQGISVKYDNGTTGGGNSVTGNTIVGAGTSGIVTFAFASGLVAVPDIVTANIITDPFRRGTDKEWNTGYGITSSAGVTLGVGPVVAATPSPPPQHQEPPSSCRVAPRWGCAPPGRLL